MHLSADAEKDKKLHGGAPKSESRAKVLSLTDIIYRSGATSDASQEGPRSEREDSDYDDEVELDFETSVPSNEEHEVESNTPQGSLNLRIHLRNDTARENSGRNGSSSPSKSPQNSRETYKVMSCKLHAVYVLYFSLGSYPGTPLCSRKQLLI